MNKQQNVGFTLVFIIIFIALAAFTTASESDYMYDQDAIITGMVEQDGDDFLLKTIDGDQFIITGTDPSDLIGKKVHASGEFIRENNENLFNVNSIVEAKEQEPMEDSWLQKTMPFEAGRH